MDTLQGSLVFPPSFVIDVSRLHLDIPYCLTHSYVDNFALNASSDSYRRNVQLLQSEYAVVKAKDSRLGVGFPIPKNEIIHCRTNRDRDPPSPSLIHLDGWDFHNKTELRWLRYWFTPSLSTTPHLTKQLAKAQATFVAVKRLSSREWASPLSYSTVGLHACTFHPRLRRGHLLPNGPHSEKTGSLLAQSPEVVYKLFHLYPDRNTGNGGLPPPPRPTTHLQEAPGEPPGTLLPTGDHPRHGPSPPPVSAPSLLCHPTH